MKTNIKSNVNGRKYTHNLTHRVSTTSGFGFCQPLMCREVSPQTTVKMRIGQSVYLQPMSKPTFGSCQVKTYSSFVPIADIWHPFESFLSGQTYRGANAHYVPNKVPCVPQAYLSYWLKIFSTLYCWKVTGATIDSESMTGATYASQSLSHASFASNLTNAWNTSLGITAFHDQLILNFSVVGTGTGSIDSCDWLELVEIGGVQCVIGGVYFGFAKDLRKVLIGCGYQINNSNAEVSLLPLFAYYKAYFDLFIPHRDFTWKDTPAFGFMEYVEQYNTPSLSQWGVYGSTPFGLFQSFLTDLGNAYYTQNPDYVSAHITGTKLDIATHNESVDYLDPYGNSKTMTGTSAHQASIDTTYTQNIGFPALNVLKKLTQRINSHTALGGRIKEFMRSVFDSDYRDEKESNFISSQITQIVIDEVMNQAETTVGYLGEYAGKGRATNPGNVNTYTSHDFGFVVVMMAVVPDARYCQAVDPLLNHITRRSFFDPEFDSVTLLPTPSYNIYGTEDLATNSAGFNTRLNSGFGNIPNYMEYKQAYDILNGEMSQRGKRSSFLPFTLDKLLPYTWHTPANGGVPDKLSNLPAYLLVNGSIWRYIGKNNWLGNFNRIFTNAGTNHDFDSQVDYRRIGYPDDNFIIHNYLDIQASAPWLPTADSFDTGSLEGNDMKVEKA